MEFTAVEAMKSLAVLLLMLVKLEGKNTSEYFPFWTTYNHTTRQCSCTYEIFAIRCHGEYVELGEGCCFSVDNSTLVGAECPYSYYQLRNLNSSVTQDEVNEITFEQRRSLLQ
jgi:hypothetical protein